MSEAKPQCCEMMRRDSGMWRPVYERCKRPGKVERAGKWYCGQHDPEAIKARRDKTRARWDEEAERARREAWLKSAAPALLAAAERVLADCPDVGGTIAGYELAAAIAKAKGNGR